MGGCHGAPRALSDVRANLNSTQPTSTPSRGLDSHKSGQPEDHLGNQKVGQGTPSRQAREDERLSMSQISKDDPVRELLKASNVDNTRIEWLREEGFTTRRALGMLTPEAVDTLVASRADRGPTPLAQVLALKHVACGGYELGRGNSQRNEAPRNPRRRIEAPRPQSAPVQPIAPPQALPNGPDGWSLKALRDLLNGHRMTPPSSQMNPRMDFEDPTTLMRM